MATGKVDVFKIDIQSACVAEILESKVLKKREETERIDHFKVIVTIYREELQ